MTLDCKPSDYVTMYR